MSYLRLTEAQNLNVPNREEVLRRDHVVKEFWESNRDLLADAWIEWEEGNENKLSSPNESFIDLKLRESVNAAWENPNEEYLVAEQLEQVSLGVYKFQFFDPGKIRELRSYLDKVNNSQIPLRPPYGIVLNRKGAMLDRRSEGFLAAPSFQSFYQEVLDKYMRPIARLLFPEITGYDTQTFGFSIEYKPEGDTSIRMHTDASSVTLNINLNLPDENFTGSELDFYNLETKKYDRVKFEPGVAILHRGNVAHAALPITSGARTNFVLWLYGDQMQIPRRNSASSVELTAQERWTIPSHEYDSFAPF